MAFLFVSNMDLLRVPGENPQSALRDIDANINAIFQLMFNLD